jgi:ribosomal protein S18 acetylase RimI-like enzyme
MSLRIAKIALENRASWITTLPVLGRFPYAHVFPTASEAEERYNRRVFEAAVGGQDTVVIDGEGDRGQRVVAVVRRLPWDSAHLGLASGALELKMSRPMLDAALMDSVVRDALRAGSDMGLRFISARIAAGDALAGDALKRAGFRVVDSIVTSHLSADGLASLPSPGDNLRVTAHTEPPNLEAYRGAFRQSRLYQEPCLGEAAVDGLWLDSMTNAFRGRADEVVSFVNAGETVGFVTCKDDPLAHEILGQRVCTFVLVAVAANRRGQSIGSRVLRGAIEQARTRVDHILVGTQSQNTVALALYVKAGFRPVSASYSFHWTGP